MGKFIDLTGRQFDSWEAIEYLGKSYWRCKCINCGTERKLHAYKLNNGGYGVCDCIHSKFLKVGDIFGDYTIIKVIDSQTYICKCKCGKEITKAKKDIIRQPNIKCMHRKDLTGQTFGEWKVLRYIGNRMWECECSCGNIKNIQDYSLTSGKSLSCGHPIREGNEVYVGAHINNWTVLEDLGYGKYRCKCDCGTESIVNVSSLRYGYSKSCGCQMGVSKRKSMLEKYGETASNRINNPRELEQVMRLENEESLRKFIEEVTVEIGNKPTIKELYNRLNINKSSMLKNIHKFNLEDMINWYTFTSNGEIELRRFIESIYKGEVIYNSQSILNGKELDIYIPEFKLAIEFNGNYWHSSYLKEMNYHINKTIDTAKIGIRIIHIFEYEWNDDNTKRKIKNLIESIICTDRAEKIYARKTEVLEISNKEAYEFCEKYHLQGGLNSKTSIGMYYNNELIAVMTFGDSRYSKGNKELYRLCYKNNIRVIGGTQKLFNYYINNFECKEIVSYCNIAKFDGKVYEKLGFKTSIHDITKPNYVWKHSYKDTIYTRYQAMKHKLIEMGLGTEDETEDDIMYNLGFLKIYDCGNLKFKWTKEKSNVETC